MLNWACFCFSNLKIARHLSNCKKCFPRWESCEIITTEHNELARVVKESLFIEKNQKCFSSSLVFEQIYKTLLSC